MMQDDLQAWLQATLRSAEADAGDPASGTIHERLQAVESCLGTLNAVWHDDAVAASSSVESGSPPTSSAADDLDVQLSSRQGRIGRFVLRQRLGSGGMGAVYLAEDPALNRNVAIKIPLWHTPENSSAVQRFRREAETTARLRHPNIVGIHESGSESGLEFIVTEFIDGPDLRDWLSETDEPVPPDNAAWCVEQLADAVHTAHRAGVQHRDLKPANVLLEPVSNSQPAGSLDDYIPRITDFGLARDILDQQELTDPDCALGTAAYCAPEQLRGNSEESGPHSDVFALGVMLYQLLTGVSPFRRGTNAATALAVLHDHPKAAHQLRTNVSADLSAICEKCLQKQPGRRYATAADLRDDLRRYRKNLPTLARPLSRREQLLRWARRAPYKASLLGMTVVFLAVTAAGFGLYLRELRAHRNELSDSLHQVDSERRRATQLLQESREFQKLAEIRAEENQQLAYDSDMRLAFDHLDRGDLVSAQEIVQQQSESPARDLVWGLLNGELQSRLRTLGRHSGPTNALAAVPGTRRVVSVGTDGMVRLWSLYENRLVWERDLNSGTLHAVAVDSVSGAIAVTAAHPDPEPLAIHILDPDSGSTLQMTTFAGATGESICWSPDGTTLAIGQRYDGVRVWEPESGRHAILPGERRNESLSFFQDSSQLLIADSDGLRLWKTNRAHTPLRTLSAPDSRIFFAMSADHSALAVKVDDEPYIRVRTSADQWNTAASYSTSIEHIETLAFSPSGDSIAATGTSGQVQTLALAGRTSNSSASPLPSMDRTEQIHAGPCRALAWVDDDWIVAGCEDGLIRAYKPHGMSLQPDSLEVDNTVDIVLSQRGELCVLTTDGALNVYRRPSEAAQWQLTAALVDRRQSGGESTPHAPSTVWKQAFARAARGNEHWVDVSESSSRAIIASDHNRIAVFDLDAQQQLASFEVRYATPDDDEWFKCIAISPDGRFVAAGDSSRRLHLWSVDESRLLHQQEYTDNVEAVCFSPDSSLLLAGGKYESFELIEVESQKNLWSMAAGDGTGRAVFNRSGDQLITGHDDGTLRIWDVTTGAQLVVLQEHGSAISDLILLDHDRLAISLDERGDVRLWNLRRRRPIGRLFSLPRTGYLLHRLFPVTRSADFVAMVSQRFGERLIFRVGPTQ